VSLREIWDERAEGWVRWARAPGVDSYWRFHRDRFFDLVPSPGRLTVEVGCGEGRVARDLAARGHRVLSVDSSPTMVRYAREASPELDVRLADATALPLENADADLAVAFMSLMNLDDLAGALREIARVLEPGGRLCAAVSHPFTSAGRFASREPDSPFVVEGSYFERRTTERQTTHGDLRVSCLDVHRPLEDYAYALADAGFVIERLREVPDTTDPPPDRAALRWRRLPVFLHVLARTGSARS
jgi:SAM-dependent methyltransferase